MKKIIAFASAILLTSAPFTFCKNNVNAEDGKYTIKIDNVFANPGDGSKVKGESVDSAIDDYIDHVDKSTGKVDPSYMLVPVPIKVYNFKSTSGYRAAINLTDEEKEIFTFPESERVALRTDDVYTGDETLFVSGNSQFNKNLAYFAIAFNDVITSANDGDTAYYMYFKIADNSSVINAAKKMGLELKNDNGNNYYAFPIDFSNNAKEITNASGNEYPKDDISWEGGYLNVYVNLSSENSNPTVPIKRYDTPSKDNPTSNKKLGDVDNDKSITAKDATMILVDYANSIAQSSASKLNTNIADVNKDGNIDAKDATVILRFYAATIVDSSVANIDIYKWNTQS